MNNERQHFKDVPQKPHFPLQQSERVPVSKLLLLLDLMNLNKENICRKPVRTFP